jgi:AAA15 family ATPase/GTPase
VILLLEFGVSNFFSFKEGAVVSFRFDGNTPESISKGLPAATVMGINGANASGKTHLLKALDIFAWFGASSFDWKPEAPIPVEPFGGSKAPSTFYAEFALGGLTYTYEFSLTGTKVVREALYRTKIKKVQLFERRENKIHVATKEFEALHTLALRKNVSVISTLNQHQLPLLQDVYGFLRRIGSNVGFTGFHAPYSSINKTAQFLQEHPFILEFVEKFISQCDTGVSSIKILQREGEKGEPTYYPVFMHKLGNDEFSVSAAHESSGTKYLFQTLPDFMLSLELGTIRIVDEADLHLHPHIFPKIIQLFDDKEKNSRNGQLIFTSHNPKILDYLGRYRSYLVTKRDNESFAFRLDEIPGDLLRNDRPVSPTYDEGKLGGVPRV